MIKYIIVFIFLMLYALWSFPPVTSIIKQNAYAISEVLPNVLFLLVYSLKLFRVLSVPIVPKWTALSLLYCSFSYFTCNSFIVSSFVNYVLHMKCISAYTGHSKHSRKY
jgi:hypothetical protein